MKLNHEKKETPAWNHSWRSSIERERYMMRVSL